MRKEHEPWSRALTSARWAFRSNPEISRSFRHLKDNESDFHERINEFDDIRRRIEHSLRRDAVDRNPALRQLRTTIIDSSSGHNVGILPDVGELLLLKEIFANTPRGGKVTQTFQDASVDFPAWAESDFERVTTSASGILLEGYGMVLGKIYGEGDREKEKRIQRLFVLAAETEMLYELPDSQLLKDLAPWIKEEAADFPDEVQERIRNL